MDDGHSVHPHEAQTEGMDRSQDRERDPDGCIPPKSEHVLRAAGGRVGVLFSGGLDSSLLVALCSALGAEVACYTAGYQDRTTTTRGVLGLGQESRACLRAELSVTAPRGAHSCRVSASHASHCILSLKGITCVSHLLPAS